MILFQGYYKSKLSQDTANGTQAKKNTFISILTVATTKITTWQLLHIKQRNRETQIIASKNVNHKNVQQLWQIGCSTQSVCCMCNMLNYVVGLAEIRLQLHVK